MNTYTPTPAPLLNLAQMKAVEQAMRVAKMFAEKKKENL